MPKEKTQEELAEKMLEEIEADESFDDLTRGTEVYEEVDNDVEDSYDGDPQELDFEPTSERSSSYDDMDTDSIYDHIEDYED